jgi:tetratricopeptide (TPR) repeat protein
VQKPKIKKNALTSGRKQKGDEAAKAGHLQEAQQLFESVCRSDPMDVEAWVKLSLVNKRIGNISAAETCGHRAVALQPRLGFSHYALGAALHAKGLVEEAIKSYRSAIQFQPDFADCHYLLGNALHETGAIQDAIASYHHALTLRPAFPEALGDLGGLLLSMGELEEAEAHLHRALALQPMNLIVLSNYSHLLRLQDKVQIALETFRHALLLAPNSVEIIAGLAGLLEKTGNIQEAAELVEQGLALAPTDPTLNLVAAQLSWRNKCFQDAADRLEWICQKHIAKNLEAECRLLLGQTYDQLGLASKAYPQIVEGKQLKALLELKTDNDRYRYLDRVSTISSLCTAQLSQYKSVLSDTTDKLSPTFLIGFPRSGTTLLEQILDSHPQIQTMEEKGAVAQMANEMYAITAVQDDDRLSKLTSDDIQHLRVTYYAEIKRNIKLIEGMRFIDKLPLNLVYAHLIWRVFPNAKFILAVRHPCDVCLSCLMQNFAVNEGMASFFSLEDTVRTYAAVMGTWQKYVSLLPLEYHRIRYEDLIGDVEGEARKLLKFLDIDWDDAVLNHTEHARQRGAINTPSYHQVTQPIYQNAKYRWHRYLDAFEPFMQTLQPFIEYFGYAESASKDK